MESQKTSDDMLISTETTSKNNKSIELCDEKDKEINETTDVNMPDIKTSDSVVVAAPKESSNKLEISQNSESSSVNEINDSLSDMEVDDSNIENETANSNRNKNINLLDCSSDNVAEKAKNSDTSVLDTNSHLKNGENTDSKNKIVSVSSSDSSENDSSNSSESSTYSDKLKTQIINISDNSESSNSQDAISVNLEKDNDELVDISENADTSVTKDVSLTVEKSKTDNSESTENNISNDICSKDNNKSIETSVRNGSVKSNKKSSEVLIDEEEGKQSLFSSEELDLSKHSKDINLNSKIDVAKQDPKNSALSSNATSCSNKLNISNEPKPTEDLKKRHPIYSDDDDDETMSSIEKVSHMDSESMDCEEVSIDDTDVSNKKTDNASEVVDDDDKLQEINKNQQDVCKEVKEVVSPTEEKKPIENSVILPELSNEETGFPEMFTGLVKVGRYISVKGDFTLRSNEALLESPSLVASYLLKEPHLFPVKKQTDSKSEGKDFFHNSAGEFLIGIGISRVNEWFQRDMVRIKKRQIKREGKQPKLEEDLELFQKSYFETKRANDMFTFPFKACQTCRFTTESAIVMEGHLLVPHITPRREYQCNFCSTLTRDPREMLFHMESKHKKIGRIQPPVLFYECPFCTFESNSKVKLNSHLSRCQRLFNNNFNQAPARDFEFPAVTPKPITVEMVKSYQKSMNSIYRGKGRVKKGNVPEVGHPQFPPNMVSVTPNHGLTGFQSSQSFLSSNMGLPNQVPMPNMNLRPAHSNAVPFRPTMPPLHLPPTNRFYQVVNSSGQVVPLMGNSHLVTSPSQFPFSPNLTNSGQKKMQTPNTAFFNSLFGNGLRQQAPGKNSDLTITAQLPKLQGPYPVQLSKANNPCNIPLQPSSLVVCEICDGYIKDLEQLRTHMQLIHKVKIHPKMLVSRPPLNCQKCQWRYFTDQGLERHLLGAHGLVTSNMQELSCKNKDAGCCTICGRVYASKLVSHMSQVHKITLKPAHLSYKCTVCSATFNLYRLFENHVYLVHSGAAKRPSDGSTSPAKKLFKSIENSEKSDSPLDHSKNRKERENSLPKDLHVSKCKECGSDVAAKLGEKHSVQSEKCEKCLNSDGLLKDAKSCNEELIKRGKECETV